MTRVELLLACLAAAMIIWTPVFIAVVALLAVLLLARWSTPRPK